MESITGLIAPVYTGDLDLAAPLPELNGIRYRGARLLARLHGWPVGEAFIPLPRRRVNAADLAALVWPLVADGAAKHCAGDGIPPPACLPPGGLALPEGGECTAIRPPPSWPAVTVVIATRNRPDSLQRCLRSVAGLAYPAFDVVVVDSAPSAGRSAAEATRQDWPFPLRYLRVPRPGLALAHNAALRAASGEIVAITDDDVEVDPGWLTALAAGFAEPGVACVTGLILPAELETPAQLLVEQAGGFARGLEPRMFGAGMATPGRLFPFTAGRFGSGANMAFRTRWLADAGGFDPAAGAGTPARGGDDLIAFLAVITSGAGLVYQPAAIVRHWHRRDYGGLRRQAFGYGAGLGAYLTASLCRRPALLAPMLRRAVPALRHLSSPGSEKNSGQQHGFPRELVWRERAGIMLGPFGYAVSRWRYRGCR